jgi:hypothetical protein
MYGAPGGPSFLPNIAWPMEQAALIWAGVGCLGLAALSMLLPWVSFGGFGSASATSGWFGVVMLLLLLGAGGFVTFAFLTKQMAPMGLLAGLGTGALCFMWTLIVMFKIPSPLSPGIGLFLALLATAGAAVLLSLVFMNALKKSGSTDMKALFIVGGAALVLGLILGLVSVSGGGSRGRTDRTPDVDTRELERALERMQRENR